MKYNIFKLIFETRYKYFPTNLKIGNCIDVCILISCILQKDFSFNIKLINGKINGCYHTWLKVNGIQIDPAVDCTITTIANLFVNFINNNYFVIEEYDFDFNMFYNDLTIEEYIKNKTNCNIFRLNLSL